MLEMVVVALLIMGGLGTSLAALAVGMGIRK